MIGILHPQAKIALRLYTTFRLDQLSEVALAVSIVCPTIPAKNLSSHKKHIAHEKVSAFSYAFCVFVTVKWTTR